MNTSRITSIVKISGVIFIVYVLVCFGFYFFQEKLIYQPDELTKDYKFQFDIPFQELFIKTDDGTQLNVLLFKTQLPSKGLVIYFHGNADNLQRWGEYAIDLTSLGYDVLMPEYRGYGKSEGKPSEQLFYKDAMLILKWASENLTFNRLVFYGRSLGTGVASHLAAEHSPNLLILETPFDNLNGVVYPPIKPLLWFLPLYSTFPNNEHLKQVSCRKVIIHGTSDWVVPLSSALRLKPLLGTNDVFKIIQNGSHKNLRKFDEYHKTLRDVLL